MISKTSSRGAAIRTEIGPSPWRLRPHPRSRLSRPMASSRKLAAIEAIRSAPSAPIVIQRPVTAATAATIAAWLTPASAGCGEDRVAERALGDRPPGRPDELDRLLDRHR
jgi:hypothetical protein